MRITKVYTRMGDQGRTRLAGGEEVWKDSLRVEAYGTVDELSAAIGVVRAFNVPRAIPASARLEEELRWIQNKLFDIGGLLANRIPGARSETVTGADHMLPLRAPERLVELVLAHLQQ